MITMKKLETYLFFNGNCGEAMRFYESLLGGDLRTVAVKDTPEASKFPPNKSNWLLHSKLDAEGATIMASDWMHADPYPGMHGFYVCLTVDGAADAKALFDKLAEGGQINQPFGKTFYSEGFGMLVDRFGAPWMVMAE